MTAFKGQRTALALSTLLLGLTGCIPSDPPGGENPGLPAIQAVLKKRDAQGNVTPWSTPGLSVEVKATTPNGPIELVETVPLAADGTFTLTQKKPTAVAFYPVERIDTDAPEQDFCDLSNVKASVAGANVSNLILTVTSSPQQTVTAYQDKTNLHLVYADRDVEVTGYQQCTPNREPRRTTTLTLSLKRGWNALLRSSSFTGSEFNDTLKTVPLPKEFYVDARTTVVTTRPYITGARIIGGSVLTLPELTVPNEYRMVTVTNVPDQRPTLEVTFSEPVNIVNGVGLRAYPQKSYNTDIPFDYALSTDRRTLTMKTQIAMPFNAFRPQMYSLDARIKDDSGEALLGETRFLMATRKQQEQDIQLKLLNTKEEPGIGYIAVERTYQNVTNKTFNLDYFILLMPYMFSPGEFSEIKVPAQTQIAPGEIFTARYSYSSSASPPYAIWGVTTTQDIVTFQ